MEEKKIANLNSMVNLAKDDPILNANNFLDALKYRNLLSTFNEIITALEDELSSKMTIYPSFIGCRAIEEGYTPKHEQQKDFKCLLFKFEEYDSSEIYEYIKENETVVKYASDLILNTATGIIVMLLNK